MITAQIKVSIASPSLLERFLWFFRKKNYQLAIPQTWSELRPKQVEKVMAVLMNQQADTPQVTRVKLLQALLSVPEWVFFRIAPLDIVEKLEMCVLWMLAKPVSDPIITQVSGGRYRWRLPAPAAKDMSIGQYLQIEKQWAQLATNVQDKNIDRLISFILRREDQAIEQSKMKTGLLPNLSDYAITEQTEQVARLKDEWKYYVLMYWTAQRDSLREEFPEFFSKGKSDDTTPKEIDWDAIPVRIAETQVFGPVHQVLVTPVRSYLAWANARQEADKEKVQQSLQETIRANHNKFLA